MVCLARDLADDLHRTPLSVASVKEAANRHDRIYVIARHSGCQCLIGELRMSRDGKAQTRSQVHGTGVPGPRGRLGLVGRCFDGQKPGVRFAFSPIGDPSPCGRQAGAGTGGSRKSSTPACPWRRPGACRRWPTGQGRCSPRVAANLTCQRSARFISVLP